MLLIGDPSINGQFSMAMLNNQRVCDDDNYDGIRDTIMADRMGSIMMIDYS